MSDHHNKEAREEIEKRLLEEFKEKFGGKHLLKMDKYDAFLHGVRFALSLQTGKEEK